MRTPPTLANWMMAVVQKNWGYMLGIIQPTTKAIGLNTNFAWDSNDNKAAILLLTGEWYKSWTFCKIQVFCMFCNYMLCAQPLGRCEKSLWMHISRLENIPELSQQYNPMHINESDLWKQWKFYPYWCIIHINHDA